MRYEVVNPEPLGAPSGWNHGMVGPAGGRVLFIAGQTGVSRADGSEPTDFVGQFGAALENILTVVREAGGEPSDVGRLTIYVTSIEAYLGSLKPLGTVYREAMGQHYPAMALVEVVRLVDPRAVVEIEATAILGPSAE